MSQSTDRAQGDGLTSSDHGDAGGDESQDAVTSSTPLVCDKGHVLEPYYMEHDTDTPCSGCKTPGIKAGFVMVSWESEYVLCNKCAPHVPESAPALPPPAAPSSSSSVTPTIKPWMPRRATRLMFVLLFCSVGLDSIGYLPQPIEEDDVPDPPLRDLLLEGAPDSKGVASIEIRRRYHAALDTWGARVTDFSQNLTQAAAELEAASILSEDSKEASVQWQTSACRVAIVAFEVRRYFRIAARRQGSALQHYLFLMRDHNTYGAYSFDGVFAKHQKKLSERSSSATPTDVCLSILSSSSKPGEAWDKAAAIELPYWLETICFSGGLAVVAVLTTYLMEVGIMAVALCRMGRAGGEKAKDKQA